MPVNKEEFEISLATILSVTSLPVDLLGPEKVANTSTFIFPVASPPTKRGTTKSAPSLAERPGSKRTVHASTLVQTEQRWSNPPKPPKVSNLRGLSIYLNKAKTGSKVVQAPQLASKNRHLGGFLVR